MIFYQEKSILASIPFPQIVLCFWFFILVLLFLLFYFVWDVAIGYFTSDSFSPLCSGPSSVCSWYLKFLILSLCKARMPLAKVAKPFLLKVPSLYVRTWRWMVPKCISVESALSYFEEAYLDYGCLFTSLY